MTDVFDNPILCKECRTVMKPGKIAKNGFILRIVQCPNCLSKIIHPVDKAEYESFSNLKSKTFSVKMRLVGNSYAVSIPKEIVSFIKEQENIMNDMVRLCFEEANKISLFFDNEIKKTNKEKNL